MVSILPRVGLLETTEMNSFLHTSSFSVGHPMIDNVAAELNGTRVECHSLSGSGVMATNTQILINVIGNGTFCDIHSLKPRLHVQAGLD